MQKYREQIFPNHQFGIGVSMKHLMIIGMENFATSETELAISTLQHL
jgi:hypothetical protein